MQQAARCSDYTAYMYLGDLVEFEKQSRCSSKPQRKETEDYITGVSAEETPCQKNISPPSLTAELPAFLPA